MAMDVFERLNRKFGVWYEGLFGSGESRDLRPRDILRRILAAMEDGRREGLDGKVYVPNVYTLHIAVEDDDERCYLRTFLSAEDLAAAVSRSIEQHGYLVRGALVFTVEEIKPTAQGERVRITHRFDAAAAAPVQPMSKVETPNVVADIRDEDEEPGTIPAIPKATLASLVVRGADGTLQDVYPLTARGARIGRGRQAGNDIIINGDGMISKNHARIAYEQGQFFLHDDHSMNGTFVAEEPVRPELPRALRADDEIRIGDTRMLFRPARATPHDPVAAAPQPFREAPGPVYAPAPANGVLFRLIAGDGEAFPLASSMAVGRSLTSDIVVIGNGVSTQHARLTPRGDMVYVEDLSTPAGTHVNGERIPAGFPVALYDGDQVGFGEVLFRLQRTATSASVAGQAQGQWR